MSFKEVWKELEVVDKGGIRFEFKLHGETFWIDKTKGIMRRLVAAERVLTLSITDRQGIATGTHDKMIDHMMEIVSYRDEQDKHDFDSEWREKIVSKFDESLQIDFLENLPYSVAAVILGEVRAARAFGQGITLISENSTNPNKEA